MIGRRVRVLFAGRRRVGVVVRDLRESHPNHKLPIIVDFSRDLRCIGFAVGEV